MVAMKRPGGQTRKIKEMYFQLCLGKVNVELSVLGWGRHIVRKVVGEGRRLERGTSRGGIPGELANWDKGASKSDRVDEESPYDSQKQLCKKTEGNACEVWTVTLKRLEVERPRKLVLGTSTLEMGWHVHIS